VNLVDPSTVPDGEASVPSRWTFSWRERFASSRTSLTSFASAAQRARVRARNPFPNHGPTRSELMPQA